jgi:type IV secretory pathway protease TraF
MTDDLDDPFLVIDEAAKVLRVSRRTLDNYRSRKQGPPYRRHGGRIVYRLSDLLSWSERRRARHAKRDEGQEELPGPNGAPRDRLNRPRVSQGRRPDPPLEHSASVPIGLYRLGPRRPSMGDLAVIRLPEAVGRLAATRGCLRAGALLIKPVVAGAGDLVCRDGPVVAINRRTVAHAKPTDAAARPLPAWSGCIRLAHTQVFVLSADPDSFDSRYFGPLDRTHVLGTAVAVPAYASTPPAAGGADALPR